MAKLYFKYGAMGSSKSAQALMCKFNYEQRGYKVYLAKPALDNRWDGEKPKITSRIGLSSDCDVFEANENLFDKFNNLSEKFNVIIIDEAQFCSSAQIDQLKELSLSCPVLCYGLLINFKTFLFEGSKRLVEIADSLQEIKSVCKCGRKASVNARIINGKVVCDGPDIVLGGDECYEPMRYNCWKKALKEQE